MVINLEVNEFLKPQRKLMVTLGYWPSGKYAQKKWYKIFAFCNLIGMIVYLIPESHYLSCHWDLTHITDVLCPELTVIVCAVKFAVIGKNWNQLNDVITKLQQYWIKKKDPEAVEISIRAELLSRRLTYFILALSSFAGLSYAIIPIARSIYELREYGETIWETPIKSKFIYDLQKSPAYEITFVWYLYGIYVAVAAIVGIDLFFFGICIHICVHFKILQRDLENVTNNMDHARLLKKNANYTDSSPKIDSTPSLAMDERLKSLIIRHRDLIELSDQFRKAFSPILITLLLISSFIICVIGFQATLAMKSDISQFYIITYASYLAVVLLQLFLYSWAGTQIIEESGNIADSIYFSDWWTCSAKFRNALQFVVLRAQRPCTMHTIFYVASLDTFTTLVSTASSYLALLQTMMENN